uniref:putative DNA-dependent DNA polymerase family B n=1 Tax=Cafeteria roenbergensis virus (strain BV-PW1) TaxID=693272 RepID=UPI0001E7AE9A|nr:putative DNA-dependent DNA polymerase family B [Cafeteria roenbergensis virus BV-PW1]
MASIEFQIYDYRETHQTFEDEDTEKEMMGEYIIQVFGRTQDGESVYAKLKDFHPRFYIKIPENWTNRHLKRMETFLKSKDNRKIWNKDRECLVSCSMVKRKKAYGFTNNKLYKFAVLTFTNYYACKKFASLFELNKVYIPGVTTKAITFKIYEANLTPMLRCFHIQDIPGCGWVRAENFINIKTKNKESTCNYEIVLSYKDIKPIVKESNAPLRICSFDIECDSCDGMFPQANRPNDNIIQIGCTYTLLGKSEPYRQYICTLNSCDNIEGATVESFDVESDLLLAWLEEIKNSDADILTGYNIFYFDEKYIMDRAKYLGIEIDIKYLSKLKTFRCPFKEQKLASSALGENLLRYFDTPGLVHIDLMKDVQKTYNLSSYKLDKVASNFIKGNVKEIKNISTKNKSPVNKFELICDQVNDLHQDDYIHLELMESFVSEDIGDKFKIIKLDIENKIITIKTKLDLIEECDFTRGKIYWSQAKDDVPPKEIFKMQHMGSKERCTVAKYCLKDCKLVNLLINKLEIVTKNIEMANVCYVPLSYLFVRGQGIKLFSLCLKEYRKHKFLFPVVKKPDVDLGSYEGAIVFDPIPKVSYQAHATKDFASLYPSAIIQKNMSHETKVDNDEFDNIPGIEYFNAKFKDDTGNWQYRRFAKLPDEFGVVPTILRTLLGERKAVKKLMKVEKDPFKYAILDAKQLALKVTANSLYGQLGAATSPVRDRDIAACTTSTGREMLIYAKKYDEEILPWIINGLQKAYQTNDTDTIEYLYNKELKDPANEKLKEQIKDFCLKTNDYVFNPIIKYGDTDSIFSCYQYRENTSKISTENKLTLFQEIIKFGKELILPFIPREYQEEFDKLYTKYYGKIRNLKLNSNLKVKPEPTHFKIILPIHDRLKQFLKEYLEESYFPWLWTLHDIFTMDLSYLDYKQRNEIMEVKLFNHGFSQIEKMRLLPSIFSSADKYNLINQIRNFCKNTLKQYYLIPYWKFNSKTNKLEYRMDFRNKGDPIIDKRNLDKSIDMGIISGELIKKRLPFPHDLEYEKTFWPYLILTKKRYVGNKYEFDRNKYKLDYMGIVLKRRDNAPIVKEICNGIINKLIEHKDPEGAYHFLENSLNKMFNNEYNIKYFLTSKTLKMKESYADWKRIAHVVLSERIGERDPGNKPQAGDRISFAVVEVPPKKGMLQGERIETPDYIKENNLTIDYLFYLTNQIEKPALQFLKLAVPNVEKRLENLKIIRENEKKGYEDIYKYVNMNNMIDSCLSTNLYEL